MTQTIKLACPVCQTEAKRELNTAINTKTHPELKRALLEGSLLSFECEHCGAKRQIETQMLYHDPDQRLLFYLAPNFNETKEEVLAFLDEVRSKLPVSLNDYQLRIVLRAADLVEKVQIFEQGYDDQEIELVKLLTDGLFAKEKPDAKVNARYFFIKEQEPKILYLTDDDQLLVDFHHTLLEFVRNKFRKALSEAYLGQYIIVNHNWALNIAENKEGTAQA